MIGYIFGLMSLAVLVASPAANEKKSDSLSPNLLRNGNFSCYQGEGKPADWTGNTKSGSYAFLTSPTPSSCQNPPLCAVIVAKVPGQACYYQDVHVLKGTYRLEVEIQTHESAKAAVMVGDQTMKVDTSAGWKKVELDFSSAGESPIRICLYSLAGGTVVFRNAQLKIQSLECSAVPLSDGSALGSIVIPQHPTPSEKYAGYELQKFIAEMTGHVPGIAGRDVCSMGRKIVIGGPIPEAIKHCPSDSYLIAPGNDGILLAGNTSRGTLYAVYDFLKTQGCGWYMPGEIGQVIPRRTALDLPRQKRIESPDYSARGMMVWLPQYFPEGGSKLLNAADYLDWGARNRINAIWYGGVRTGDFEDFRGGSGCEQTLNHSWRKFFNDEHPEWWSLIDGKRVKLNPSGAYNQLCVSNKKLRDYVVETIVQHFKENPGDSAFALNPEDSPTFWCECPQCRALDADGGKGHWEKAANGQPKLSMTDRVMNFTNEVAARVVKVCPGKQIELYAYDRYVNPPQREKVHPNILIKSTLWPGLPYNQPLSDWTHPYAKKTECQLDGWKKAGTKHFALYDYGNYERPDCPWLDFYSVSNYLRTFYDRWGFEQSMGETSNYFPASLMMYNLRAQVLWNTQTDYKAVINDVCEKFYGPAGDEMKEYYAFMDGVLMKSNAWKKSDWHPLKFHEYTTQEMLRGKEILERADRKVRGKAELEARVAIAQYGHAFLTFNVVKNMASYGAMDQQAAHDALALVKNIWCKYKDIIPLSQVAVDDFKNAYLPPAIVQTALNLPLTWQFKKDPGDHGLTEKWFASRMDKSWQAISTEKDWTSQGHSYHGVAWYAVEFKVDKNNVALFDKEKGKWVLYFGAVDGEADIYLDGQKIGEQKRDPGYMWNKSFTIPLPSNFNPSISHVIAVRVKKTAFAAGIWKPVRIVTVLD